MIELTSSVINIFLVAKVEFFPDIFDLYDQQTVCSVAVLLMWIRLFPWLALFTPTAFYVELLKQTFSDITYFMLLYVIIVFGFGNVIFVLN